MEKDLRDAIVAAFGLETPSRRSPGSTGSAICAETSWLRSRAGRARVLRARHGAVGYRRFRGDIWYEFPYDEQGKERVQPMQRRPSLTLFTEYLGEKIPLARYGTTVGGWRTENIDGTEMWRYKGSPVGPRVWKQIVRRPSGCPAGHSGQGGAHPPARQAQRVDRESPRSGPSYASAYGLVAAYHAKFREGEDGELLVQGDEGIRTHARSIT